MCCKSLTTFVNRPLTVSVFYRVSASVHFKNKNYVVKNEIMNTSLDFTTVGE